MEETEWQVDGGETKFYNNNCIEEQFKKNAYLSMSVFLGSLKWTNNIFINLFI